MLSHLLSGGSFEELLRSWVTDYGRFVQWQLPGAPAVVVVTDHDAIRQVSAEGRLQGGVVKEFLRHLDAGSSTQAAEPRVSLGYDGARVRLLTHWRLPGDTLSLPDATRQASKGRAID